MLDCWTEIEVATGGLQKETPLTQGIKQRTPYPQLLGSMKQLIEAATGGLQKETPLTQGIKQRTPYPQEGST